MFNININMINYKYNENKLSEVTCSKNIEIQFTQYYIFVHK